LRRRFGLPEEGVVALYCGKLLPVKRPLDFVAALAEAARPGGALAGLVVGDGPLRGACEAAARDSGAPVHFAGFLNQSEIGNASPAADLLVLPGAESWGLVVNEAMSCGRPCLVSDAVGCGPELVVPGETGDVFPLGGVSGLAARLAAAAQDPEALAGLGRRA